MKQEKLERITIYLTKREKKDAQIAAAHAELNMATLGRKAIQYLIYAPEESVNVEPTEGTGEGVCVGTEGPAESTPDNHAGTD
jgi:hypothetical protein